MTVVWCAAAGAAVLIAIVVLLARGRLMPHGLLALAPLVAAGVYAWGPPGARMGPAEVVKQYHERMLAGDIEGAKALVVEPARPMVDALAPVLRAAAAAARKEPGGVKVEVVEVKTEGDRASVTVRMTTKGKVRVSTMRLERVGGRWLIAAI